MPLPSPYRPHDPGHDYYAPGIYLITLVVRGRQPLLGTLGSDPRHPTVHLSELGQMVQEEWNKTPAIQARQGRHVKVHTQVVMPDHWHTVVEVEQPMDKSLGDIMQAFKSACTARWRSMRGLPSTKEIPGLAERIRSMSHTERQAFYETPEGRPYSPLWDDNYDDTICLTVPTSGSANRTAPTAGPTSGAVEGGGVSRTYDQRHLSAMKHYVDDNPRRAIVKKAHPEWMRRCLHIRIAGRDYAAFGNLFLLRWGDRRQVFFHRRAQRGQCDTSGVPYPFDTPYVETCQYAAESAALLADARAGRMVMVTPGISEGEKRLLHKAIEGRLPLIHLQKEPIGSFWKPEQSRFDACADGTLLILAPWAVDSLGDIVRQDGSVVPAESDYSRFHNLNGLAAELCQGEPAACVVKG